MPRCARIVIQGYLYHITQRGNYKQNIFEEDRDCVIYLKLIQEYSKKYGVEMYAYCLMDNHVHFIAKPRHEESLARTFCVAHQRYSHYYIVNLVINSNAVSWYYLLKGRIAMSLKQFRVKLSEQEHQQLQKIVRSGKDKARKITRGRILLLADGPNGKTDQEISDALGICLATIFNIRRRCHEEGLERAIGEGARSGQPPKFKGKVAAKITAIAWRGPADWQGGWNLGLVDHHVVELDLVGSISHQSISNILKKTNLSLTSRNSGVSA